MILETQKKCDLVPIYTPSSAEKTQASGATCAFSAPIGVLPCLYRNNSNEILEKPIKSVTSKQLSDRLELDKKYRKTSVALAYNVQCMAEKYPLKNLGFLTLTFADDVQCYKLASKRFNSLATRILNIRYRAWMKVMERQKSGRIHFHLIIVLDQDIRTGFDFARNNDYSISTRQRHDTASAYLKSEWDFYNPRKGATAKKYGFGRTELLPIKSSSEAIGRYVGKYISKHLDERIADDKGARLVSYSKNMRVMNTKFSWVTDNSKLWRAKVKAFCYFVAEDKGCEPTFDGLKSVLGSKWAYNHRKFIMDIPI